MKLSQGSSSQVVKNQEKRFVVTRLEKKLELALESYDREVVIPLLKSYIQQTPIHFSTEIDSREKYYYLISLCISFIQKKGWYIHDVLGEGELPQQHESKISHENLLEIFSEKLERIVQYGKKDSKPQNQLIQRVINIVSEKVYEDITLKEAADLVFVNSSYLSRLFKREVGQSFSHYVMEQKMLHAKALLNEGYRISDVAQKLAYNDVSYFTKVFRKYWGMTPRDMLAFIRSEEQLDVACR
ncbi:helix-turn-helix transcriptional regulator [Evansella tamaricis]|uniref:AraC family transcriptional regulator n=1 Tax=Evansella tamaricis TaxID=2069301 RepID=A0ABS6JG95_9BACI|nr:AraC family transcriptional regulator [Evansella tamaricis]MBU9712711.1 AraC family transcriptional regulator [Evansella tamaricis]